MHQISSTEVRQDYLKIILQLIDEKTDEPLLISNKDIANAFHVKPPSVTEIMMKMQKEGYVERKPRKGVRLTKKGLAHARKVLEMHRIVDNWLTNVLKVQDLALRQRVACKMDD